MRSSNVVGSTLRGMLPAEKALKRLFDQRLMMNLAMMLRAELLVHRKSKLKALSDATGGSIEDVMISMVI